MDGLFNWANLGNWGWLITGFLICLAEMLLPGSFLLWIGLAAISTGILLMVLPALTLPLTLLLFAALTLLFLWIGREVYGSLRRPSDKPFLNRRADALVGQIFLLDTAITNGQGRIRVQDSVWTVRGTDMAKGERVRVMAVEDAVHLRVERVS